MLAKYWRLSMRSSPSLVADAAGYFFFDGEKIDKFARPDNAKGIREVVKPVLKFVDLDRAIAHLDDVAGDYEKHLRGLTSNTTLPRSSRGKGRARQ